MKIKLYHGTDCIFDDIDLSKCGNRRDFGVGFYTTTIASQAENWARAKRFRNNSKRAYVYVYDADIPDTLDIKKFDGLTVEWLEMIKENRNSGGVQHSFDVVIGPVANDDTRVTVARYMDGIYSAEEAIKRLEYSKVNDQVTFHTLRSLECLVLQRRYSVE